MGGRAEILHLCSTQIKSGVPELNGTDLQSCDALEQLSERHEVARN
jgi:hypothetical protein